MRSLLLEQEQRPGTVEVSDPSWVRYPKGKMRLPEPLLPMFWDSAWALIARVVGTWRCNYPTAWSQDSGLTHSTKKIQPGSLITEQPELCCTFSEDAPWDELTSQTPCCGPFWLWEKGCCFPNHTFLQSMGFSCSRGSPWWAVSSQSHQSEVHSDHRGADNCMLLLLYDLVTCVFNSSQLCIYIQGRDTAPC